MSSFRIPCLQRRRARLNELISGHPVVIAAGRPQSRNFQANVYPYRASSHFLYLVGLSIPGAVFVLDNDGGTLYVHRDSASDLLWHGPSTSLATLTDTVGCSVRYLDELSATGLSQAMTLPVMDYATNHRSSDWVGRPIGPGIITSQDEPLAQAMVQLRMVHDEWAIEELELAAEVTIEAHQAARRVIRPGIKCSVVWAEMQAVMTRRGMTAAYNPIVTPYGEVLHSDRLDYSLNHGDLILIDVGAETASGWAGDVTRTWPVSGRYSSTQQDIYDVVLSAHMAAISAVQPGVSYRDVHLTACRILTEGLVSLGILRGQVDELVDADAHAIFFPHGVGHLIGLDVHDMEDLGDRPGYAAGHSRSERFGLCYLRLDRPLEVGMAITIEPGFYQVPSLIHDPERRAQLGDRVDWNRLAHFTDVRGIRIEDDVLVEAGGRRVLTSALPTS